MIGIYVGESFAEIAAKNNLNGEISFNRWFLPQLSIEKGIEKFLIENNFNEVSEVRWMTRFGRQVIHKGLGHNPALLVTEGFESWPFMNLPIDQIHFSAFPEKQKPPIQSHLIFGISERVNSKGEIDKKLDTEELEFLVSKLQLNKIEHVAIGLLHSNLNPSHEKLIEEYLKERGFKVFPSYKFNTSSSEKPRWWSSVLNAYLEPSFNSLKKSIQNGFESQNINCEIKIHHSSDIYNDIDGQPLNSLFGPSELFSSISQDESKAILYFGIEEFLLIPAFNKNQKYWNAPFGRVAINHRP
ncbi:MAG: hypothetical protein KDC84_16255, partial [Crocinitomicaceae bacterium]|nr:hypothetical protein [Crocinitomicaceae bacterium]